MNLIKRSILSMGRIKLGIKRFYLTSIVLFTMATIFLLLVHDKVDFKDDIENLLLVLFLAIPISTFAQMIKERINLDIKIKLSIDAVFSIILLIFYFLIPEDKTSVFMIRYFITMFSSYFIFTIIPYFYKRDKYSLYMLNLLSNLGLTILFAGVINIGLAGIIFITDTLFELDIDSEIYADLSIFIWVFFAVVYFLGRVPKYNDEMNVEKYPKILKVLITYILIPIISVYTIILYAYFGKLIFIREFPINILNQIVVWYAFISITLLFFIRTIKEEKKYLSNYYKYYPAIMVVPVLMLFTSLFRRMIMYGITPPRYFSFIVATWIAVSILYIFLNKKYKGSFLVSLGIGLLLFSIVGPQNAFNVSFNSQSNRFETLLKETGLLVDGSIIPNGNISSENKQKVNDFINYFREYNQIEDLTYLKDFESSNREEYFGFGYTSKISRDYKYYNLRENNYTVSLKNIDSMYIVNESLVGDDHAEEYDYLVENYDIYEEFIKFYKENKETQLETIENATMIVENNYGKIEVIIERLNIIDNDGKIEIQSFEGIVLEKLKN